MSKLLCIYHGNCDDGFGAAYAVWKKFGDKVEFVPGVYGNPPPDVTGRHVLLVDFSYKRPVLEEMAARAKTVLILDHHKTAAEDLAGFREPAPFEDWQDDSLNLVIDGVPPIAALFDMNRSGAGIAWDFFHRDKARPALIDYIEDRDLWRKSLPGIDEFTAALRSYPQDFGVWDWLDVPRLIEEGRSILRYYRTLVDGAKKHVYRRNIGGYVVPVVNAPLFMASDLAGELAENEPFAAVYAEDGKYTSFSLRSRAPDGVDVSEIAKRYGGGGHKHAAGFRIPVLFALEGSND